MADKGEFQHRISTALDRLAWGIGDCRQLLIKRGWWPVLAQPIVSSDSVRWSLAGDWLRPRPNNRKATGLLIPESECLWGSLRYADMPSRALGPAVQEAMWRVSPLPPDQIVAAWRAAPDPAGGWLVEWGICRRSVQNEALAQQALDATAPVYLARQGRALPVRNVNWQALRKRQWWMNGLGLAVVLIIAAAVTVPALMPLILKRQAVVSAVRHVSEVEPNAAPLRLQLDQLRAQTLVAEDLRAGSSTALPLANVIDKLSEILPDDTWLDRIEINGNSIRITGLTANAVELIARLGRQAMFADVRATSANVRDNALNKERFAFEMRWRGEEAKP